ncbi:MAG TPA: FliI/YscN family ATPase [Oligoflexia bacterium]|nr:FliI/YscN family ATPase [Oligoflexia bacterium]
MDIWTRASSALEHSRPITAEGIVTDIIGLVIEGSGPTVGIGTTCEIRYGERVVPAQVVGFRNEKVLLMPLADTTGLAPGASIISRGLGDTISVSKDMLGRVIDPMGRPLDGKRPFVKDIEVPLFRTPPDPLSRKRVNQKLDTGIKVINGLLSVGQGQRIAIMAGSGVGKSTFLGMLARHAESQVNVIALVGERGREVREFIEKDLGPEGLKRSILVVATSDSSALMRVRAAMAATAIAEFFRDQGCRVNLMVDSITRYCMALREVGLAVGEPPTAGGYTPSVFAELPRLLERAGTSSGEGSITAFYTVLVEADDINDPVADAVRGILDGHIVLSRKLASKGQYPAVDILNSLSRVMSDLVSSEHSQIARLFKETIAAYQEVEDLILIGAYKTGQNPMVDLAIQRIGAIVEYLKQTPEEKYSWEKCEEGIVKIFSSSV